MFFSKQQSSTDLHADAHNSGKLNASAYRARFALPAGIAKKICADFFLSDKATFDYNYDYNHKENRNCGTYNSCNYCIRSIPALKHNLMEAQRKQQEAEQTLNAAREEIKK